MQPSDHETAWCWTDDGLRSLGAEPADRPLLAMDSFLVVDGTVRGYDLHWTRFAAWCAELGIAPPVLARFRDEVSAVLPRTGRWFPRLEALAPAAGANAAPTAGSAGAANAGADPCRLRLRLRDAPPGAREARVLVGAPGDPRTRPRWKGPDIELLLALRARAVAAGADELLLCNDLGRLVEGGFDSLLWWHDDVLCTTPDAATLPGVTRRLLLTIAAQRGTEVRMRSPRPAELAGRETWLTNALHGIRVVTSWGDDAAPASPRADAWRAALDATARPLDAGLPAAGAA